MQLASLDWAVIVVYIIITFILGLWFTKRAGSSLEEYFVAGRSLPWWIAGTSIAATWFATDAPLATAALVRQHGIFGNWLWWYETGGLIFLVFFVAKFWRRANILTDAELIEIRYSGRSASILRLVSALYQGVLRNLITMGWVMLAMAKFGEVLLGWRPMETMIICGTLAVIYTVASGLWGVVLTDMFQFVTGLFGSLVLAVIVVVKIGGIGAMVTAIQNLSDAPVGVLDIIPNPSHISPIEFVSYLCLFFVLWSRAGQSGYPAQRLFSTKDDKHAMYATLLWGILGIIVITWPWVVVGMGSLVLLPISEASPALAADPELAYPMMLNMLMPVGMKGLLVASFLAAFMSTMDTRLCWGGSYLVNDIYKRYLVKDASDKHYIMASRVAIVLLAIGTVVSAYFMESIQGAWIYIINLTAGLAVVWGMRWYWWRVNAWSEISAMVGSVVLANGGYILKGLLFLNLLPQDWFDSLYVIYTSDYKFVRATFILVACTFIWVTVAYVTKPVDEKVLSEFYRRVRPGGMWGKYALQNPDIQTDMPMSKRWLGFILGVGFIDLLLIGIGYIMTGKYTIGLVLLPVVALCFWGVMRLMKQQSAPES